VGNLDDVRISALQWRVLALCLALALVDGFDTQSLGFVLPALATDFSTSAASFTPVILAGQLGMISGGILLSGVSDRFGRRRVVLLSTAVFSLGTLATVLVDSLGALGVLRFVTGVGIGGILPNLLATGAEHAPARRRSTFVTVISCGLGLGGFLGGLLAAWAIPQWGWHSLFLLGGIGGLVLFALACLGLPEPVRRAGAPVAARADEAPAATATWRALFGGRTALTVGLWVAFGLTFLVQFFLVSWLPSLLDTAGAGTGLSLVAIALYNLGGVAGCLLVGPLADRWAAPHRVLALGAAVGFVAVLVCAVTTTAPLLLVPAVTLLGLCVVGNLAGLNALGAASYPTAVRATGLGWAFGVGRGVSLLGPAAGGLLLAAGLGAPQVVASTALPVALSFVCFLVIGRRAHREQVRHG
jgi:AAHS family 4-hydroxybenzoate transporter-like MFS transporter